MCHGAGKQANSYYFKGDPGLYSATAQLQSGGAPIVGCSGATYCDPATYYTKNVDVPTDAKYVRPAGSCAAVTGRPVEPFALGQIPSSPAGNAGSSAGECRARTPPIL